MDSQTVGIVAAVIAVVFSVIWVVLGVKGVRSLLGHPAGLARAQYLRLSGIGCRPDSARPTPSALTCAPPLRWRPR